MTIIELLIFMIVFCLTLCNLVLSMFIGYFWGKKCVVDTFIFIQNIHMYKNSLKMRLCETLSALERVNDSSLRCIPI